MLATLDTRAVFSMIFRRLGRVFLVLLLINGAAAAFLYTAKPLYESNAKLLIRFGQEVRTDPTAPPVQLTAEEKRGLVQSNLNILTSRDLVSTLLTTAGPETVYPELKSAPPQAGTLLDAAIRTFEANLKTQTQSDAATINIHLRHGNPQQAAALLQGLIGLFQQRQLDIYNNPQTAFAKQQAEAAKQRLTEANTVMDDFKSSVGIASVDEELSLLLRQRSELQSYLTRRKEEGGSGASALPARVPVPGDTARYPVLDDIQGELARLRAKEAELLQTYRNDSDQVRAVRENIAKLERALNETVGVLDRQIRDLDRRIAKMRDNKAEFDNLERQVTLADEEYRQAVQRLRAAEAADNLNQQKVTSFTVIEQPSVPYRPVSPNKMLVLALALVMSACFAVAVLLMSEILDPTLSRTEQVATLGISPLASFALRRGRKGRAADLPDRSVLSLYHSIAAQLGGRTHPVIALASCHAREDAELIARSLARLCARQLGQRILLISNDEIDRPSLLELVTQPELRSEALEDGREPHFVTLRLSPTGLEEQLLAEAQRVQDELGRLRPHFDQIILALPGVLDSAALTALARMADGTALVITAERTRRPVIRRTLDRLQETGGRVLGAVLDQHRYHIPGWIYRRL